MTLVGVVDADLGLANGDPRAAERTFQLLNQVTGRAGRTGRKSLGLIQTYQPDHPVMRAIVSGDADAFTPAKSRSASAAICRLSGGLRRSSSPLITGPTLKIMRARFAAVRPRRVKFPCWDQPKRRLRWCAGAIGSAFSCTGQNARIFKDLSARFWRLRQRKKARSGCRWI